MRHISRELDDPGNDDGATLRRIDAELARDTLGDMDAAAQSSRDAVDAWRAQSMGLGPAWTMLLNG